MMDDVIIIGGNRHGKTEELRKQAAEYLKLNPDAFVSELKHGHLNNIDRRMREMQLRGYHDIYRYAENFDVDPRLRMRIKPLTETDDEKLDTKS